MKTIIAARAAQGRHDHENLRNGTREVCATKSDVGGNAHNSDWVVIREDDAMFAELVAMDRYKNQVRDVRHPELYGDSTRYDFEGPC